MIHQIADLSKLKVIKCLYHRTFMTNPNPTLVVTVDGEKKEFFIRWRAASRDKLYHSKGLPCILIVYDNIVLAYEIIKFDDPSSYRNVEYLHANYSDKEWYFDGEKFYNLDASEVQDAPKQFITYSYCTVIDPILLTYSTTIEPTVNYCITVHKDGNIIFQTPPISANLDYKSKELYLFDKEQDHTYISLSTLLKTCDVLSKHFGSDSIEIFDIPYYMIRHKTVNLTKLSIFVKDSSTTLNTPINFISHLVGIMYKENDFEKCIAVLKAIRRIVRGGVVRASIADKENVYTGVPIELIKIDRELFK